MPQCGTHGFRTAHPTEHGSSPILTPQSRNSNFPSLSIPLLRRVVVDEQISLSEDGSARRKKYGKRKAKIVDGGRGGSRGGYRPQNRARNKTSQQWICTAKAGYTPAAVKSPARTRQQQLYSRNSFDNACERGRHGSPLHSIIDRDRFGISDDVFKDDHQFYAGASANRFSESRCMRGSLENEPFIGTSSICSSPSRCTVKAAVVEGSPQAVYFRVCSSTKQRRSDPPTSTEKEKEINWRTYVDGDADRQLFGAVNDNTGFQNRKLSWNLAEKPCARVQRDATFRKINVTPQKLPGIMRTVGFKSCKTAEKLDHTAKTRQVANGRLCTKSPTDDLLEAFSQAENILSQNDCEIFWADQQYLHCDGRSRSCPDLYCGDMDVISCGPALRSIVTTSSERPQSQRALLEQPKPMFDTAAGPHTTCRPRSVSLLPSALVANNDWSCFPLRHASSCVYKQRYSSQLACTGDSPRNSMSQVPYNSMNDDSSALLIESQQWPANDATPDGFGRRFSGTNSSVTDNDNGQAPLLLPQSICTNRNKRQLATEVNLSDVREYRQSSDSSYRSMERGGYVDSHHDYNASECSEEGMKGPLNLRLPHLNESHSYCSQRRRESTKSSVTQLFDREKLPRTLVAGFQNSRTGGFHKKVHLDRTSPSRSPVLLKSDYSSHVSRSPLHSQCTHWLSSTELRHGSTFSDNVSDGLSRVSLGDTRLADKSQQQPSSIPVYPPLVFLPSVFHPFALEADAESSLYHLGAPFAVTKGNVSPGTTWSSPRHQVRRAQQRALEHHRRRTASGWGESITWTTYRECKRRERGQEKRSVSTDSSNDALSLKDRNTAVHRVPCQGSQEASSSLERSDLCNENNRDVRQNSFDASFNNQSSLEILSERDSGYTPSSAQSRGNCDFENDICYDDVRSSLVDEVSQHRGSRISVPKLNIEQGVLPEKMLEFRAAHVRVDEGADARASISPWNSSERNNMRSTSPFEPMSDALSPEDNNSVIAATSSQGGHTLLHVPAQYTTTLSRISEEVLLSRTGAFDDMSNLDSRSNSTIAQRLFLGNTPLSSARTSFARLIFKSQTPTSCRGGSPVMLSDAPRSEKSFSNLVSSCQAACTNKPTNCSRPSFAATASSSCRSDRPTVNPTDARCRKDFACNLSLAPLNKFAAEEAVGQQPATQWKNRELKDSIWELKRIGRQEHLRFLLSIFDLYDLDTVLVSRFPRKRSKFHPSYLHSSSSSETVSLPPCKPRRTRDEHPFSPTTFNDAEENSAYTANRFCLQHRRNACRRSSSYPFPAAKLCKTNHRRFSMIRCDPYSNSNMFFQECSRQNKPLLRRRRHSAFRDSSSRNCLLTGWHFPGNTAADFQFAQPCGDSKCSLGFVPRDLRVESKSFPTIKRSCPKVIAPSECAREVLERSQPSDFDEVNSQKDTPVFRRNDLSLDCSRYTDSKAVADGSNDISVDGPEKSCVHGLEDSVMGGSKENSGDIGGASCKKSAVYGPEKNVMDVADAVDEISVGVRDHCDIHVKLRQASAISFLKNHCKCKQWEETLSKAEDKRPCSEISTSANAIHRDLIPETLGSRHFFKKRCAWPTKTGAALTIPLENTHEKALNKQIRAGSLAPVPSSKSVGNDVSPLHHSAPQTDASAAMKQRRRSRTRSAKGLIACLLKYLIPYASRKKRPSARKSLKSWTGKFRNFLASRSCANELFFCAIALGFAERLASASHHRSQIAGYKKSASADEKPALLWENSCNIAQRGEMYTATETNENETDLSNMSPTLQIFESPHSLPVRRWHVSTNLRFNGRYSGQSDKEDIGLCSTTASSTSSPLGCGSRTRHHYGEIKALSPLAKVAESPHYQGKFNELRLGHNHTFFKGNRRRESGVGQGVISRVEQLLLQRQAPFLKDFVKYISDQHPLWLESVSLPPDCSIDCPTVAKEVLHNEPHWEMILGIFLEVAKTALEMDHNGDVESSTLVETDNEIIVLEPCLNEGEEAGVSESRVCSLARLSILRDSLRQLISLIQLSVRRSSTVIEAAAVEKPSHHDCFLECTNHCNVSSQCFLSTASFETAFVYCCFRLVVELLISMKRSKVNNMMLQRSMLLVRYGTAVSMCGFGAVSAVWSKRLVRAGRRRHNFYDLRYLRHYQKFRTTFNVRHEAPKQIAGGLLHLMGRAPKKQHRRVSFATDSMEAYIKDHPTSIDACPKSDSTLRHLEGLNSLNSLGPLDRRNSRNRSGSSHSSQKICRSSNQCAEFVLASSLKSASIDGRKTRQRTKSNGSSVRTSVSWAENLSLKRHSESLSMFPDWCQFSKTQKRQSFDGNPPPETDFITRRQPSRSWPSEEMYTGRYADNYVARPPAYPSICNNEASRESCSTCKGRTLNYFQRGDTTETKSFSCYTAIAGCSFATTPSARAQSMFHAFDFEELGVYNSFPQSGSRGSVGARTTHSHGSVPGSQLQRSDFTRQLPCKRSANSLGNNASSNTSGAQPRFNTERKADNLSLKSKKQKRPDKLLVPTLMSHSMHFAGDWSPSSIEGRSESLFARSDSVKQESCTSYFNEDCGDDAADNRGPSHAEYLTWSSWFDNNGSDTSSVQPSFCRNAPYRNASCLKTQIRRGTTDTNIHLDFRGDRSHRRFSEGQCRRRQRRKKRRDSTFTSQISSRDGRSYISADDGLDPSVSTPNTISPQDFAKQQPMTKEIDFSQEDEAIFVYKVRDFEEYYTVGPVIGRGGEGEVRLCVPLPVLQVFNIKPDQVPWKKLRDRVFLRQLRQRLAELSKGVSKAVPPGLKRSDPLHWSSTESLSLPTIAEDGRFRSVVYAVKIIPQSSLNVDVFAIQSMAQMLSAFDHPNVLKVQGLYEDNWHYYFVMELADGPDVLTYLTLQDGPVTEALCRSLMRQVLEALAYVHAQRLIHRDIKPENFVCADPVLAARRESSATVSSGFRINSTAQGAVSRQGRRVQFNRKLDIGDPVAPRLKLIDFGIACCIDDVPGTEPNGTAMYMAPEFFVNNNRAPYSYSEKIDIWSAGILLCQMLTGWCKVGSNGIAGWIDRVERRRIRRQIRTFLQKRENRIREAALQGAQFEGAVSVDESRYSEADVVDDMDKSTTSCDTADESQACEMYYQAREVTRRTAAAAQWAQKISEMRQAGIDCAACNLLETFHPDSPNCDNSDSLQKERFRMKNGRRNEDVGYSQLLRQQHYNVGSFLDTNGENTSSNRLDPSVLDNIPSSDERNLSDKNFRSEGIFRIEAKQNSSGSRVSSGMRQSQQRDILQSYLSSIPNKFTLTAEEPRNETLIGYEKNEGAATTSAKDQDSREQHSRVSSVRRGLGLEITTGLAADGLPHITHTNASFVSPSIGGGNTCVWPPVWRPRAEREIRERRFSSKRNICRNWHLGSSQLFRLPPSQWSSNMFSRNSSVSSLRSGELGTLCNSRDMVPAPEKFFFPGDFGASLSQRSLRENNQKHTWGQLASYGATSKKLFSSHVRGGSLYAPDIKRPIKNATNGWDRPRPAAISSNLEESFDKEGWRGPSDFQQSVLEGQNPERGHDHDRMLCRGLSDGGWLNKLENVLQAPSNELLLRGRSEIMGAPRLIPNPPRVRPGTAHWLRLQLPRSRLPQNLCSLLSTHVRSDQHHRTGLRSRSHRGHSVSRTKAQQSASRTRRQNSVFHPQNRKLAQALPCPATIFEKSSCSEIFIDRIPDFDGLPIALTGAPSLLLPSEPSETSQHPLHEKSEPSSPPVSSTAEKTMPAGILSRSQPSAATFKCIESSGKYNESEAIRRSSTVSFAEEPIYFGTRRYESIDALRPPSINDNGKPTLPFSSLMGCTTRVNDSSKLNPPSGSTDTVYSWENSIYAWDGDFISVEHITKHVRTTQSSSLTEKSEGSSLPKPTDYFTNCNINRIRSTTYHADDVSSLNSLIQAKRNIPPYRQCHSIESQNSIMGSGGMSSTTNTSTRTSLLSRSSGDPVFCQRSRFHPIYTLPFRPTSGSEWNHVSDEARDLVTWLLTLDPAKRPTAQEALQHAWFAMGEPLTDTEFSGTLLTGSSITESWLLNRGSSSNSADRDSIISGGDGCSTTLNTEDLTESRGIFSDYGPSGKSLNPYLHAHPVMFSETGYSFCNKKAGPDSGSSDANHRLGDRRVSQLASRICSCRFVEEGDVTALPQHRQRMSFLNFSDRRGSQNNFGCRANRVDSFSKTREKASNYSIRVFRRRSTNISWLSGDNNASSQGMDKSCKLPSERPRFSMNFSPAIPDEDISNAPCSSGDISFQIETSSDASPLNRLMEKPPQLSPSTSTPFLHLSTTQSDAEKAQPLWFKFLDPVNTTVLLEQARQSSLLHHAKGYSGDAESLLEGDYLDGGTSDSSELWADVEEMKVSHDLGHDCSETNALHGQQRLRRGGFGSKDILSDYDTWSETSVVAGGDSSTSQLLQSLHGPMASYGISGTANKRVHAHLTRGPVLCCNREDASNVVEFESKGMRVCFSAACLALVNSNETLQNRNMPDLNVTPRMARLEHLNHFPYPRVYETQSPSFRALSLLSGPHQERQMHLTISDETLLPCSQQWRGLKEPQMPSNNSLPLPTPSDAPRNAKLLSPSQRRHSVQRRAAGKGESWLVPCANFHRTQRTFFRSGWGSRQCHFRDAWQLEDIVLHDAYYRCRLQNQRRRAGGAATVSIAEVKAHLYKAKRLLNKNKGASLNNKKPYRKQKCTALEEKKAKRRQGREQLLRPLPDIVRERWKFHHNTKRHENAAVDAQWKQSSAMNYFVEGC